MNTFTRVAKTPNHFDHGEDRTTLVFCKTPESRAEAENAGATLIGDIDIIKKIEVRVLKNKDGLIIKMFFFLVILNVSFFRKVTLYYQILNTF